MEETKVVGESEEVVEPTKPIGEFKNWLSWPGTEGYDAQWFQKGGTPPDPHTAKAHAAVFACTTILAQEVAKLRIEHFRLKDDNSRTPLRGSSVSRLMRKPNHYQTRSDFFLMMVGQLVLSGNAYVFAERNDSGRIIKLHPRPSSECMPWVSPDTGDIFYSLIKTDLDMAMIQNMPEKYLVPQRDVLHIKLDTPRHPLIGESLLAGLSYAVAQGVNIQRDSTAFFGNMSRPSGILSAPNEVSEVTLKRLKAAFSDGSAGQNAGKTAVLDQGFTWHPMTLSAADAQLIETYKMTVADIAMVFRVPLYMLGDLTKATYTNVEQMQKGFQAGILGFLTEHIEASLDDFFGMTTSGSEYMEFDLERGVIRSEFTTRMEGYAKALSAGITVNENRAKENLPPVEGGNEVYLQRQNWPLGLLGMDAIKEVEDATGGSDPDDDSSDDSDDKDFENALRREFTLIQGGRA
ncbi:MAG: phage portal protein [Deltaproteobacteria bacterium]|nr:phage portal protein [Deltaproteobacteria bacterium]